MNLHKICKVLKSTVMVSLAAQPCCVYRDIIIKWGALNSIRSLLVHNGLVNPLPPASPDT